MLSVRSRRLPPGVLPLLAAALIVLAVAGNAAALDNMSILYGLREYGEYDDNLFFSSQGQIKETSINTVPDLSIVYDDGKTRWLARGFYRRESFPDNQELSGDYYAISGEFARDLNDHHTFSIVGGYNYSSSLILGQALTEPGQLNVIVPTRGARTTGTNWSPSISSFWSRRFTTTLSYDDSQSFASEGNDLINKSVTLSGAYQLSSSTILQSVIEGTTNRNSGFPFAEQQDADVFTTRVGFSTVLTPRLTMDITAGPQWTREINLPDKVTLIKNIRYKKTDPVLGTFTQPFVKEPGTKVDDTSVSLALAMAINYQINRTTRLAFDATRSSDSGQGVNGTFEQDQVGLTLDRELSRRWHLSIGTRYLRAKSISRAFAILPTVDPETGERDALDSKTFDIPQRLDLKQAFFQPRLDYRFNRWWTAYLGWDHTRFNQGGRGASDFNVNQVMFGLEFRNEARF